MSRPRITILAAVTAALLASSLIPAQQPLPFAGNRFDVAPLPARRLEAELDAARALPQSLLRASDAFAGGQWGDGLDTLVEAAQRDAGRLASEQEPATNDDAPSLARVTVHRSADEIADRFLGRVAQAAPPLLAEYRRRYEPVAAAHLAEALEARDETRLVAVFERWFLTRAAESALLESAGWALERGDYALARSRLERLHPLTRVPPDPPEWSPAVADKPLWLALRGVDLSGQGRADQARAWLSTIPTAFDGRFFPDATIDVATLKARLAWISALEGDFQRAHVELAALRVAHPGATGEVAGKQGDLAETLAGAISSERAAREALRRPRSASIVGLGERPLWRVPLPSLSTGDEGPQGGRFWAGERAGAVLPYFPAIWREGVFWVEPAAIRAVELSSGATLWPAFGDDAPPPDKLGTIYARPSDFGAWYLFAARSLGVPRFTAEISGDLLFAKIGGPRTRIGADFRGGGADEETYLVGVDLSAQGRLLAGFPLPSGQPRRLWEGAPIVDGDRLYAAFRVAESNDRRSRVGIACLEISTGATLWQRLVSSGGWDGESTPSLATHVRPILSEGKLLVDTGQGTLACIDAATGSPRWSILYPYDLREERDYPERNRTFPPSYRDQSRGLVRRGVWYAAPPESDRVLAIEIHTGEVLWTSVELTDDHATTFLLGIADDAGGNADDALVVSGRGLVWLDAISGRWLAQWPEPAQEEAVGHGKGLLVGDEILFPTEQELLVFDQTPERIGRFGRATPKRRISLSQRGGTGGNLAYSAPYLVIAGSDEIQGFRVEREGDGDEETLSAIDRSMLFPERGRQPSESSAVGSVRNSGG